MEEPCVDVFKDTKGSELLSPPYAVSRDLGAFNLFRILLGLQRFLE